jgi:flagellar basal-body rod protein FlgC
MSLSTVMNTAAQGMDAQASRLSASAAHIARAGMDAAASNDPASDIVDMIESAHTFALNADMFETGADLWQLLSTIKRD